MFADLPWLPSFWSGPQRHLASPADDIKQQIPPPKDEYTLPACDLQRKLQQHSKQRSIPNGTQQPVAAGTRSLKNTHLSGTTGSRNPQHLLMAPPRMAQLVVRLSNGQRLFPLHLLAGISDSGPLNAFWGPLETKWSSHLFLMDC
ncbi:hypothetical protein HYFRA_00008285 [Hymenoscyphus fraxineus]|uniref:Uncharacterized protein n=1 Tax=Hymenoscyphus fraxineus TaxID=746836 RepID=A0A9N9KNT8_9HELO|nr:hypothetical protein HYFRA_00008285 [Hymenoscyphus fraxineus]